MEAYANWIRRNKDYVQSLESLANGMTWFVPDRFASSEIGLEAGFLYSHANAALRNFSHLEVNQFSKHASNSTFLVQFHRVISVINQYIIDSAPTQCVAIPQEPSSFPYSLCISVMKELEILVEVIAEYYHGDDNKWNFIAITEGIKVLLRLSLFRQSGYKMLLQGGGVPNAEIEGDSSDSQNKISEFSKSSELQSSSLHVQKTFGLEGRALSALAQLGKNARMAYSSTLVNRVDHQIHIVKPTALEKPTLAAILSEKGVCGGLFLTGELLFILRPFIYVLCMKKYGRQSWTPWIISLFVDLAGMFASLKATRSKHNSSKQIAFSITEKDELKRRRMVLALYVMRDPFFCKYTRTKLESTQKALEPVPVVGIQRTTHTALFTLTLYKQQVGRERLDLSHSMHKERNDPTVIMNIHLAIKSLILKSQQLLSYAVLFNVYVVKLLSNCCN
ncbi:LOW QUALITY PROTEIN: hypothetical protein V2J09_018306 [Rumex salicifolius]